MSSGVQSSLTMLQILLSPPSSSLFDPHFGNINSLQQILETTASARLIHIRKFLQPRNGYPLSLDAFQDLLQHGSLLARLVYQYHQDVPIAVTDTELDQGTRYVLRHGQVEQNFRVHGPGDQSISLSAEGGFVGSHHRLKSIGYERDFCHATAKLPGDELLAYLRGIRDIGEQVQRAAEAGLLIQLGAVIIHVSCYSNYR
ncbi:hypothetical protein DBV15_04524 [Temnothorax longispinosus]|uniref:Uncharacterized protein n=1 Tax=Temnothorax longispinosus TaxID=300112 RepID=A0A4S2KG05_9HYME|nr:hypothetical protein DBV15_04524 [Temnothorax longispinosus]